AAGLGRLGPGAGRLRGDGPGRLRLLRGPHRLDDGRGHHRDQRQDHGLLPLGGGGHAGREDGGRRRHHRAPPARAVHRGGQEHHAAFGRPDAPLVPNARGGGELRRDGGLLPRPGLDHLDYHGTREAYLEAKARLFTLLERPDARKPRKVAVLNHDDPAYLQFRHRILAVPCVSFGFSPEADYRADAVVLSQTATMFNLHVKKGGRRLSVRLRLLGEHNVMNALAAAAVALELGLDDRAVVEGLGALDRVPGRLDPVDAGQGFAVLVDFAHTATALSSVLAAVRRLPHRKVYTVFGCGGDRDRSKRAPMGRAAAEASDFVVATSDNPRGEEPAAILAEVEAGLRAVGKENYRIVPDRRDAIREALALAQAGDVVLIAGKGHETTQTFADRVVPFDDREVAREAL
ncbi:MAG: UDP-N-acetylmuramoyl-L-alanyl-D-glutamate--2,6-diaminopimelate ligase, partial [Elusimicrobia bacterium]